MADPKDPLKAELLEAQLKRAVDHIYDFWLKSRTDEQSTAVAPSFDFWSAGGFDLDLKQIGTQLWGFVQENISMVRSVRDQFTAVPYLSHTFFLFYR